LRNLGEVFVAALKLGLTSFGGPVAHLAYFRKEYVEKRRWLDDDEYARLVALGQFLPGPASSQTGMAIGHRRAGFWGAVAAWAGFTLPSALLMVAFALLLKKAPFDFTVLVRGMELVAVAVVAQALLGMGRTLLKGKASILVVLATVTVLALLPSPATPLVILALSALAGVFWFKQSTPNSPSNSGPSQKGGVTIAVVCLCLFAAGLAAILGFAVRGGTLVSLAESFYKVGSLVFGGGHVVLPLLKQEVVTPGWLSADTFLAGYGFAQMVPGPLFSFSAFLGFEIAGWTGAIVALTAIFLPSLLLVVGVLPFWNRLRSLARVNGALTAVNAAVIGLLLWALYDPLGKVALQRPADFALAAVLFGLLEVWKLPSWVAVLAGLFGAAALHFGGF